jgi:hypothetical protein
MSKYLMHITLDTGHSRRSYRDEVKDTVVTIMRQQAAEAQAGDRPEIMPGYALNIATAGTALLATVESDKLGPLITIAICPKSRVSQKLWDALKEPIGDLAVAKGDAPTVPWCAVRMYPAAALDFDALQWLGDYERCLAWGWVERNNRG